MPGQNCPRNPCPNASTRSGKRRAEGYRAPPAVDDARPHDGDVGPGFEELAQGGHAALAQHDIGVADEQVGAVAQRHSQVGGRPVTEVGARLGPFDLGVTGRQGGLGAIDRTVVGHDDGADALAEKAGDTA